MRCGKALQLASRLQRRARSLLSCVLGMALSMPWAPLAMAETAPPQRIVSLVPSLTEAVCMLQASG